MRISQRAEHAVAAVLDLALHAAPTRGTPSWEIAERTGVPEKFLEAILLELRRAGVVASKRGPDGGHRLAVDATRITVALLLEAVDGPLVGKAAGKRGDPAHLALRRLWRRVEEAVEGVASRTTIEDLRREASAPVAIDYSI